MSEEIQSIIREHKKNEAIRERNKPKDCFVIDHDYVSIFCDPWMADQYYERAKQRICLECSYWYDEKGCQKPFGLKHLISIVKNVLWLLRWKWHLPPLNWLYCYHFRLMRRRGLE